MSAAGRSRGERLAPLGLIVNTVGRLPDLFIPIVAVLFGTRGSDLGALPVIAAVVLGSLVLRWLAWLRFRYIPGEDDIRIEHGLLSRHARSIPYERIADVSIEQPALARAMGLAVVRFETGSGKGDEAELRFVTAAEAARLREVVRTHRAAPAAPQSGTGAVAQPDAKLLFAMDLPRLLTAGLYSFSLVIFAVLLGLAQQLDFLLPFDRNDVKAWLGQAEQRGLGLDRLDHATQLLGMLAALAALIAVGIATGTVREVLRDWGFRLERTAKGLRRRRGLLTRTDVTIPVERVQAVILGSGAVRALRGWHDLRLVSLATESAKESHHLVAPLARLDELSPIAAAVGIALPAADPGFARGHPGPAIVRAMIAALVCAGGSGWLAASGLPGAGLAVLPAPLLATGEWLAWRCRGCADDGGQLCARHGWWSRRTILARRLNVQSVTIARGPIERLFGLASVHFGIPGGELRFAAIPLAEARTIREAVVAAVAPVDFSRLGQAE